MRSLLASALILWSGIGYADQLAIPHSFTGGTTAVASEVNENFTAVETNVNAINDVMLIVDPNAAGTTTAGIQEAIDSCGTGVSGTNPSDGCTIRLQCGDVTISDTIVIGGNTTATAKNGVRIVGCGAGATNEASKGTTDANPSIGGTTVVADSSVTGAIFEFQACRECSLEHLGINGAYRAANALNISASGASWPSSHSYVHDVDIRRTTGFAIITNDTTQADQLTLYKVSIRDTGGCVKSNHDSNVLTVFRDSECADTSSTGGKLGFDLVAGSFHMMNSFWGTTSTVTGQTGFRLGTDFGNFSIINSHIELITDSNTLIDDNGSGIRATNLFLGNNVTVQGSANVCFDVATDGAWNVISNFFKLDTGLTCTSTFSVASTAMNFTNLGNTYTVNNVQSAWPVTLNSGVVNTVLAPASFSGDIAVSNAGAVTIQANSVALGTDTTGNYAGSSSEGGAATTATALAANGSNCSAGSFPLGVDASGASESCTALPTFTTSTSAASGSCTTGDLWLKTSATVTLYACTATDTWSTGVGI